MSNTTLKRLLKNQGEIHQLQTKITQLEYELDLFKKMYFELQDATKKNLVLSQKSPNLHRLPVCQRRGFVLRVELPCRQSHSFAQVVGTESDEY